MFREFLCEHRLESLLCAPGAFKPFPQCGDRDAWEKLAEEKKQFLLGWGKEALNGYPQITATQYMAYRRSGDRRIFEKPYFDRRILLFGAALAECVENQGRFVDAVIDGLWLICEESTWVVSAHNNQEPDDLYPLSQKCLPDQTNPYIDLFAAQTSSVLSYVLYLLGDQLNAVSPLIASRVKREIEQRILHPFLTHNDFWWMGYGSKTVNNWNPWILSNVIDTALLVETDTVRRNRTLERAMIMLDHYLQTMPQDGGCDEGAGYFNVAGASLLDCLESLYRASDGQIDFFGEPHIAAIGSYPEKVHIAGEYYLNFADCDAKPILDGERLYAYGSRTGNKRLKELGAFIFGGASGCGQQLMIRDTPQVNRTLFGLFAGPEQNVPEPKPAPFMQLADLQVFAWYHDGVYAAIKGGHNDESHNHNDIGTFVVYVDGEPQIVDMGNKVYTAATFGPNRYELDNTRSKNHNVPLIGGVEQHAGREYAAREVSADGRGARMNLAAAYPAQACVDSLVRTFVPENGTVMLQDEIRLARAQCVTWVFMLRHRPCIQPGEARFGTLKLCFDPALTPHVEEMVIDDPRMQRSFPGSLWRLTLEAGTGTSHHYAFAIHRI